MKWRVRIAGVALVVVLVSAVLWSRVATGPWTESELALIRTLQITALPPPSPDPSNAVADSPDAARLGHALFFDSGLSSNGTIACASCHQPQLRFTDGLPTAQALGHSARNTMSLVGASYSPWYYWDGRKDSPWSQSLAPLEDPAEHGANRMRLVRRLTTIPRYRELYASVFGALPDFSDATRFPADAAPMPGTPMARAWEQMQEADRQLVNAVFANLGKALAAYERQLRPGPTRFDAYVDTLTGAAPQDSQVFTSDEAAGLRLFIGRGRCLECHNGPLFTNNEFHNTGLLPPPGSVPDQGRSKALALLRADPFNCVGAFSDAAPAQCIEFKFMRTGAELLGAMRTPSLRNLGGTAPYMHKGQLPTLADVLAHYNEAPFALIGHNETEPLGLSGTQLRQLEAFLLTLDAPLATAPEWLAAPRAE